MSQQTFKNMEFKAQDVKFTTNIADNVATMQLIGDLGADISGKDFANEMYFHASIGRKIKVNINSPGGELLDTFSIIEAIRDTGADTHIIFVAASAAGILAQFGKNRTANDYAAGMIHPPRGKNSALLKIVTDSLVGVLENKTSFSRNQIEEMMLPGKEKWMQADEMERSGFIDKGGIIKTGQKDFFRARMKNSPDDYKIYAQIIAEEDNMDTKEIKKALKLAENADDSAVLAKVVEMSTTASAAADLNAKILNLEGEKTKLTEEKAALTAKVIDTEGKLKDASVKAATELVDSAILAKKIRTDAKATWVQMAVNDYTGTKAAIDSIQVFNSVAAAIGSAGADASVTDDYEKIATENPTLMAEIMEKDPARFERMSREYQKKQSEKK